MSKKAGFHKFSSLRLELMLMAMILVLVMCGSLGLAISLIYSRALGESQLAEAEAFARGAALSLTLSDDWTARHISAIENAAAASSLKLLLISEARGRAVFKRSEAGARDETALRAAQASGVTQSSYDGQRVLVAAPVTRRGQVLGAVCFAGEARGLRATEEAALRWMIAAVAANILLMGLFIFFYLNSRLLSPFKELARDLADLGRDQFRPRSRHSRSLELEELFEAFDRAALELTDSRRRLEEQLETIQQTQAQLIFAEKMGTVGRLASGLAHELGNPIGALTGFVHLLRRDDLKSEDKKNILDQSAQELRRMDGSIKELLHFSRPSRPQPEPVEVREVAEAALSLARPQKWAAGVDFSLEGPENRVVVLADRNGLLQIFLNLLANAGQALAEKADERRVEILIREPDERGLVRLRVSDNGPGVDPADAAHLFEPYFTRKEPGQGTGLGLAISQSLVQNYGGRLDYAPAPGGGAAFDITLTAAAEIGPGC